MSAGCSRDREGNKAAEEMHRWALTGREKVLGKEHPDTLMNVSNLGLALQMQGRYEEAGKMHRQALAGSEKTLGGSASRHAGDNSSPGLLAP
jgi:hypothetical protein